MKATKCSVPTVTKQQKIASAIRTSATVKAPYQALVVKGD